MKPDGGIGDGAGSIPMDWVDGLPHLEHGDFFRVEIRIDNPVYAGAEFVYQGGENSGKIAARAAIETEEGNASAAAHVEVAFTGFLYHTVSDWGPVLQRGDLFILDAKASEVQFFAEPELPYFERHTYRLPTYEEPPVGVKLDFERIETHLQIEEPRNAIIQTADDWWSFIGVESGPLVDPMPQPVDLSEFTSIGVALGERSDTCHGISIRYGVAHDGWHPRSDLQTA
ncbi:MAG: hypothetical protein ABF370_22000 [Verrucomicrobiales bacterium]